MVATVQYGSRLIQTEICCEYKIQTTWILETLNEKQTKKANYLNMIYTDHMLKQYFYIED